MLYPNHKDSEKQLRIEIDRLLSVIENLQQENQDLQMALLTTAEHGDTIEEILEKTNQKLRQEIDQRKQAEKRLQELLNIVSQQRDDLEVLIKIITEHGDIIDAHLYKKIEDINQLLMNDHLTNILNRRGFDFNLHQQWRIYQKKQHNLTLLFCDIDYFKQYNDIYGHLQGDDCLQKVAELIYKEFEPSNSIVCRYGGEEFAVILPEISLQTAFKIAQKTQQELAKLKIVHKGSLVSSYVTISVGITSVIPHQSINPEEFIDYADRLMYLAKSEGRNKIIAKSMK